jgi:hypothetical protein
MSATTKMMILGVLGGLTSSSDARAHHWVAWIAFLAQALLVMVAPFAIHAARDKSKSRN